MGNLFTDNGALSAKGQKFNEYAADLTKLLSDISNNIEMIAGGELKGTAVSSLVQSYEEIKTGIENHIKRIDALGTVVTQTAQGRSELDGEASTAAQGAAM